jgi:isatin hydrolase
MTTDAVRGRPISPDGQHEVVDLTVLIAEDLPCSWPTHQPFQHKTWNWFTARRDSATAVHDRLGPYATRWMAIDEHTGTHVDAPNHFLPPPDEGATVADPASVDRIELDSLMGPTAVLDVSGLEGTEPEATSPIITPQWIESWEARHHRLSPSDVVLLHTGWDRRYQRGAAGDGYARDVVVMGRGPAWPAPGVPAMRLLLERGVRCIGTDAPTIGPAQDAPAVHRAGLAGGAVFVECLTGLDRLPPRGAWFCFLPLKVEGGTGAPGRAVAWVPVPEQPGSDHVADEKGR